MSAKLYTTPEIKDEVVDIIYNRATKAYVWGANDKFPNELIRKISDSGTATSCVGTLSDFIQADGFINEQEKTLQVNGDQTADDLLSDIAQNESVFEGEAYKITFRIDGTTGNVYCIPLKELRPNEDGSWRHNPRMGERGYIKADDVVYNPYNPKLPPAERSALIQREIAECGKQKGEIYVVFQKKLVDYGNVIPSPACASGLEDIESDAALQRLDKRNIKKGFRANVIITLPGQTDDKTKDVNGKTERDYLDQTLKDFTGEDATSIAVVESKVKGEDPKITPFPFQEILNGTSNSRDRIPKAVCRHFGVPPLLIGLEVPAILGNDKAVVNSIKMFLFKIKTRQNRIRRAFKVMWPQFDWTVSTVNPYEYFPPELLAQLTPNEIRSIWGFEAKNEPDNGNNN